MKRTVSISNLLKTLAHPELASLYSYDMECQVNVARGDGERVDGEFKGIRWQAWSNGIQTWKSFRIPYNAMSDPHYDDPDIKFDLEAHAQGIGMTGWDWNNKKSLWVAYDFDAIVGHSDKHAKKLSNLELDKIKDVVKDIPWVTVRYSTSGTGLHLYVFLNPVSTNTHTEHAALARSILAKMSGLTGFDFESKVDVCGGNMWVWHRKMKGNGLKLIKEGSILEDVPVNWKDHLEVTSGRSKRATPRFIKDGNHQDMFEEMVSRRANIKLDPRHDSLIKWLDKNDCLWSWDQDTKMLITHTCDLKDAHKDMNLRGVFDTISEGNNKQNEWNCFANPVADGGWVIRRFTKSVAEHHLWDLDKSGWSTCFYNVDPDLPTVARYYEGIEDDRHGFNFDTGEVAIKAAAELKVQLKLEGSYLYRNCRLSMLKDGRLKVELIKEAADTANPGWLDKNKYWLRIFKIKEPTNLESEVINYDDVIRHLVTPTNGSDYNTGWSLKSNETWRVKKKDDVKIFLRGADKHNTKGVDKVLASCIQKPWTIVCKPFQPEFLGDRMWNRNAAQLRYTPSDHNKELNYPTWKMILDHIGSNLDEPISKNEWCKENSIITGADYLKCWLASLFQEPDQPLPYLFLYSLTQGTGKSIFHESIQLLMNNGVARAESALLSQGNFNGELEGAVLCIIEETDLRSNKAAQERIKDWVTSPTVQIHHKGMTPYIMPNTWHFIQCGNSLEYCPIFNTDTRITMIEVPELEATHPKKLMFPKLEAEAPDFLAELLNLEIPDPVDRLNIPIIETDIKKTAAEFNKSDLEVFIDENCNLVNGHMISFSEFYDRFMKYLPKTKQVKWSKVRTGKSLPKEVLKGRVAKYTNKVYIGNISWDADAIESEPYILNEGNLVK
jgi:hypothetical protein